MKQLKALIIEDTPEDAERIKHLLVRNHFTVCGVAASLQEALFLFDDRKPDISIVDIYLDGKTDGIAFAEKINAAEKHRHPFIFLTNATDRTTFNMARLTDPFSYLLKPFNELELQYAIELAIEKTAKEQHGHFASSGEPVSVLLGDVFFVKRGNILSKILAPDIRYIEVDGKYSRIIYGNDKFVIQRSLKQLQDQLPIKQFVRVHRNYIVNLKEIQKINLQNYEIILQDGSSLTFSRRYLDDLMHYYNVLK